MQQSINILMAQINVKVGAIEANAEKIASIIKKEQEHHDLIVFPELALSGYPPEDLLDRESFFLRIEKSLEQIKKITGDAHVILGHPSHERNRRFNSATVFHQEKRVAFYHKQKLPNYGIFDELRYFTPGEPSPCILSIKNHRLALCICEDLWQPGPMEQIIHAGADAVICINASPFDYEKPARREKLLQSHAQHGLAFFYVNLVGGQDELIFDGQSLAFDAKGQLQSRAPAFKEQLQSLRFKGQDLQSIIQPVLEKTELIYEALVCGTRDYVEKNGFPGVLLGLSGGIDSALTLAIAVDALGPSSVHAVLMPSRYTAKMSIEDAKKQIKKMGVHSTCLSIEPIFKRFLKTLAPCFKDCTFDKTEENLQARIRGMLLMALSNKNGNMVLTTSNKSETAVGYATLYGDMAGGFAVLKDVLKTQVYELAQFRNCLNQVIPERVLHRSPSAELAENQKDQDSLPAYPLLDAIIRGYMESNLDATQLIHQGYPELEVNKVIQLIKNNEYKRRQGPVGPKISPRAFGRDWRFPISSSF